MLNILYGRAGTGKTTRIMQEIKHRMDDGQSGMLLIVPEQYSHDAERQLCEICGDGLSLHADVLSFTRLSRYVLSETGGLTSKLLDKSGQILVMYKAIESVQADLKIFGVKKTRPEMLESLLKTVRELRSMCITPQKLEELAELSAAPLGDKLRDFALITGAYEAMLKTYGGDSVELLTLLAEKITDSTVGTSGAVYIDGFIDFTAQEMVIIEKLLKKGAEVTVCLTCTLDETGNDSTDADIFEIPRSTIAQLKSLTKQCTLTNVSGESSLRADEIAFIEKNLFNDITPKYPADDGNSDNNAVSVYAAASQYVQCQYVAAKILELVHSGYRWRDIGVMTRDFAEYESICEQVFDRYGIPYFTSGTVDIQAKPPIALIDAALDIATMGFEYRAVFRYLKSGMLPFTTDEISILENYVLKWNIRGYMWFQEWTMPPAGYQTGKRYPDKEQADDLLLKNINDLRQSVITPLIKLRDALTTDTPDVSAMLHALYTFITDISLPETMAAKAEEYKKKGHLRTCDEYKQLLGIIYGAMEQMHTVLETAILSASEFRKMIALALSQYDVGVIPVSLDRVPLGAMSMSRRRDLKCLIIPGATDDNIPKLTQTAGILSDNERAQLSKLEGSFSSGLEERLYREMNMIYSTITLPHDKLILMYDTQTDTRPSFIVKRICEMFGIEPKIMSEEEYMSAAQVPCSELLYKLKTTHDTVVREQLSPAVAQQLYGNNLRLSATRVNGYYSCSYRHFLQSGLRLQPRTPALFDAASAGTFIHYVLDGVLKEITQKYSIASVDDTKITELTNKYIAKFKHDVLLDFTGKNKRFQCLFIQYEESVIHVVRDTIDELKGSKFTPIEFELNLAHLSQFESGAIDRVDAYKTENDLYIRIVDYKTRRRAYSFEMSDILHGMDMQMLIYMLSIEKYGEGKFGAKPKPAGVLYVPARDIIINAPRNAEEGDIAQLRQKEMKRSGIIIDNPVVIEAMESGDIKKYLPVKTKKDGTLSGDCLVSESDFKILTAHVDEKMKSAKQEILNGTNQCIPYYKNMNDNACTYCQFGAVCGFDEQMGDKHKFIRKMKAEEVWEELKK